VILSQKRWAELQKDFISNMTHEFKTPISSIKISSDVMSKSPEIQKSSKLNTYLSIIKSQNQRLNRQVEQVLSLAKLENDKFELQIEKIHVQKVFEEIEEAHKLQIESMNGKFIVEAPEEDVFIRADRSHFFNVLNNLVDNAVKYSDDAPLIHLVLDTSKDNLIKVEVRDNGKGIPSEYINKITDKFFRVPKGNVHDVKGFGLGLYYVNNICKAHKWTFKVESKVGNGTICRIFININ
jgi:two-component system phosphate regulon sensor histidine kinase PhoR